MGNFLNRTTKAYYPSRDPNELPEDLSNYISAPDLSAVAGVPVKYWKIVGDVVTEMSQAEKDAVDAAILDAARDNAIAELDSLEGILRQVLKIIMGEINILRSEHGLSARTLQQLKTAIRNSFGT